MLSVFPETKEDVNQAQITYIRGKEQAKRELWSDTGDRRMRDWWMARI